MRKIASILVFMPLFILVSGTAGFAENSFERELVVKDQTRSMKVESVFKELIKAYEDEDAQGFLALVSDERFRQDYITFTDALYSDFRTNDIHQVDYWIDRIVPDNVKHFLYVKWEKRYETLDNGRQNTARGYSRFLFDEVNGKYLLVELAGNSLFGSSLKEWNDELPKIAGAVVTKEPNTDPADPCAPGSLSGCSMENCEMNGGYWYNNQCNTTPEPVVTPCAPGSLTGCSESNCLENGGYWYNSQCNATPDPSAMPDLEIASFSYINPAPGVFVVSFAVRNNGTSSTTATTTLSWQSISGPPGSESIPVIAAGNTAHFKTTVSYEPQGQAEVDPDRQITESNEDNNVFNIVAP